MGKSSEQNAKRTKPFFGVGMRRGRKSLSYGLLSERAWKFAEQSDGSGSVTSLFIIVGTLMIGGLAVDQANGWRINTQLQVASDASALVAAANLEDEVEAKRMAVELAALNLGRTDAILIEDIVFGSWNRDTGEFSDGGSVNAVRVAGSRQVSRNNGIATYFLKFVGVDILQTNVASIAVAAQAPGGGSTAGCEDAVFLSENQVNTGGGLQLQGAVCIHGERGVQGGGGSTFGPDVRFSAPRAELITLGGGNTIPDPNSVRVERSIEPKILPELNRIQAELWAALWTAKPTQYSGELLPNFIYNADGYADVVYKDNWWNVQPDELKPHTIYVVSGGIGFSGGVAMSNIAVITNGQINIGGWGGGLQFDNVFFSADAIGSSGSVSWGPRQEPCARTDYSAYLFAKNSLSLGGNGGSTINGVVGAAGVFRPGGAMNGSNLYFESRETIQMGGDVNITGCGEQFESEYTTAEVGTPQGGTVRGSYLAR